MLFQTMIFPQQKSNRGLDLLVLDVVDTGGQPRDRKNTQLVYELGSTTQDACNRHKLKVYIYIRICKTPN